MNNNDILRRLRYALNLNNAEMVTVFKLGGTMLTEATALSLLKKELDDSDQTCTDQLMISFLDGLIIYKRGPSDQQARLDKKSLTNNMILKKIRIALKIQEDHMLAILELGGYQVSKYELSALFRRVGQKNYKECGDQFLRGFLNGLTEYYRPGPPAEK